jgi:hypothetical protein
LTAAASFTGPRCGLDMWHPTGAPERRLAIGSLAGESDATEGAVDLVLVAPSAEEASSEWVEAAIVQAAELLSADGLLWIMVGRRWRRSAERSVSRCGLTVIDAVLAIPGWRQAEHLVPLSPVALRDAAYRHLGGERLGASMLRWLIALPFVRRLVQRMSPACAYAVARDPGLQAFRWLGELDGTGVATATVSLGTRSDARVAVALRFPPGRAAPDLVVKAALDEAGVKRLTAERAALERLGTTAAGAGTAVPVAGRHRTRDWLLATDLLPGRSAAAILSRAPRRLLPIASAVADWLLRWNAATARRSLASPAPLDRWLLGPLGRLAAAGVAPVPYARALELLASRIEGGQLILAAAHGDLTMANVMAGGPTLAILDWEAAAPAGLPLSDLWYMLADGVARAARVPHAVAVKALAGGSSPAPRALGAVPARHAAALGLTVEEASLAFHSCWLAHADDELRRGVADAPFTAVVRAVAEEPRLWPRYG